MNKRLLILLYHGVGPKPSRSHPHLTVSPEAFNQQIQWLGRHGYVGIRCADLLEWRAHDKKLPDQAVLLTFDDGHKDLAEHAFPILQHHRFSAAVFLVTNRIGGINEWDRPPDGEAYRLLNAEQIRTWTGRGIEFGSHTRTHPDLTQLSSEKLRDEITGSWQDISELLGTRVLAFAYPYGLYNKEVLERVRANFSLAFTTDEGLNDSNTDILRLRRASVRPTDSMGDFSRLALTGKSGTSQWMSPISYTRKLLLAICRR
ncbi:MAG: polysaccharide deacetylase family protein [Ignavibacteriales bacterium]|nr:polysaccharide deacetylase family protein [Ignavibacteriales bacterium]